MTLKVSPSQGVPSSLVLGHLGGGAEKDCLLVNSLEQDLHLKEYKGMITWSLSF